MVDFEDVVDGCVFSSPLDLEIGRLYVTEFNGRSIILHKVCAKFEQLVMDFMVNGYESQKKTDEST